MPAALASSLPNVIRMDSLGGESSAEPELVGTAADCAYVLYTSGSTGVPKGVVVRSRNLVNYTCFIERLLALDQEPAGLHFATVSALTADLGNTSIFPALSSGGCLHLLPLDIATDALAFEQYTRRHPLDVLKIVPSHLAALLDAGGTSGILPRRYLILGGEALSPALVARVRATGAPCAVINHYGPTETTVGSLTYSLDVATDSLRSGRTIPIGRPIANTRAYLLDAHREPVPLGVTGELYLAGAGVTAGYREDPERTAERFLPDLIDPASTMYRTGDRARYGTDGLIEFLGRADDQVKIRGYRVELAEIEGALAKHDSVRQAVVLARPDPRGDLRLIAYVVLIAGQTVDSQTLASHLKQSLPDYMVPSAIVVVAKMPLTANGKVDRQQLPEPEPLRTGSKAVAPRTAVEAVIAGIWCEVLRRESVGVTDNFFEAGGHSLVATQVISRMRRSLDVDPPLRLIFDSPTVAGLAEWVEAARQQGAREESSALPRIVKAERGSTLPLSLEQQRLWLIHQMDPGSGVYNVVRALRLRGHLNLQVLERAINEIVRRHESQRTTFRPADGAGEQVVGPARALSLPVAALSGSTIEEREAVARERIREEAKAPFDLEQGPLVRVQLLALDAADHIFVLSAHHIVSDAWSSGIFFSELGALYEAFLVNQPSPLPELAVQYADYALWQRQRLGSGALERHLDYWRNQLAGAPPVLKLPTDRPRAAARSFEGASQVIALAADLTKVLKEFSRREDVTLFMTLVAGFQALLARYSGQDQIVVGTDVANRTTTEAETLMGFFINLLVLRTDFSGNPTFRELLKRVRRTALDAYAHQHVPFDKLVEELQPERRGTHSPIVQVQFVMQNTPSAERHLTGLELSGFGVPITHSKFDLSLLMVERGDRLAGHWVYRTDLFEPATIERMGRHFEALLRRALEQPDSRLSTLAIESPAELEQRERERKRQKQLQRERLTGSPLPVGTA